MNCMKKKDRLQGLNPVNSEVEWLGRTNPIRRTDAEC